MQLKTVYNFGLSTLSAAVKSQNNLGLPVHLTIEPTTSCNLRCPVCETGARILERPKGTMSLENFKKVLDTVGPQVNTLFFYYMGEPFLNKDAPQMISEAVDRGIYVSVCTNGESVDETELIASRVSEVSFQIGGLTQETHSFYRRGGDLALTLDKLCKVIEERRKRNSKSKITVGFIVMKHNEHEIPDVDKLKMLGIDEVQLIMPCVRTVEQGKQFLPASDKFWYYDRQAFRHHLLIPKVIPHNRCWWIYYSTVITWDGNVLPCCRDAQGHHIMGNVFEQSFNEIWNGEKYRKFRRQISEIQSGMKLCRLCSGYGVPRLY